MELTSLVAMRTSLLMANKPATLTDGVLNEPAMF